MKYLIVLCCIVAAAIAEVKYTDKYDKTNILEILENKRMLENIADCLRGKGPCSPEAKELKEHLQEALENGCAKCTDIQIKSTPEIVTYLMKNEPALWEEAIAKYDPTGQFRKKYEKIAQEHGLQLNFTQSQ